MEISDVSAYQASQSRTTTSPGVQASTSTSGAVTAGEYTAEQGPRGGGGPRW